MKVKISKKELNECVANVVTRLLSEAIIDINSPEDYIDYDNEYEIEGLDDIDTVTGGKEYLGVNDDNGLKKDNIKTIKTDIDKSEKELIKQILTQFENAEMDVISGSISFNVPKRDWKELKDFLIKNQVNIVE